MFKLVSFSLTLCVLVLSQQEQGVLAAWDNDDRALLDRINSLHQRVFAPEPGKELSLDQTMDLLQASDDLFEDEVFDETVGDKQNDLNWLKTLSLGRENCNTEWIGMIELSEGSIPSSKHMSALIRELSEAQLVLCLELTAHEVRDSAEGSSSIHGALGDLGALVASVKSHGNGAPLTGNLSEAKLAVAEGLVEFLERGVKGSLNKLPGSSVVDLLRLVDQTANENLEPSCHTLFRKFGDQYGFFRRMMASNKAIEAEPKLLGWFEGMNLCKKIFKARVQNLFLIAKYDPSELANKLKVTVNKSEQDELLDIYRFVSLARKELLDEDLEDIQVAGA